jgi:hypothetical protein
MGRTLRSSLYAYPPTCLEGWYVRNGGERVPLDVLTLTTDLSLVL